MPVVAAISFEMIELQSLLNLAEHRPFRDARLPCKARIVGKLAYGTIIEFSKLNF